MPKTKEAAQAAEPVEMQKKTPKKPTEPKAETVPAASQKPKAEKAAAEAPKKAEKAPTKKAAAPTKAKKAPAKKTAAKAEKVPEAAEKAPAKKASAPKAEKPAEKKAAAPKAEKAPAAPKKPRTSRKKVTEEAPAPIQEEAPVVIAPPAKEEATPVEAPAAAPVMEEVPVVKEAPVMEEAPAPVEAPEAASEAAEAQEEAPAPEAPTVPEAAAAEEVPEKPVQEETPMEEPRYTPEPGPRRSVAFIGSECYPFVKTGGLADVMYALPKALSRMNCDVKVILPRYRCIPWEYQSKMVYRGEFQMSLCSDGRSFYVGIMEYVWDGVVYDFIDNQEFFSDGNPYTSIIQDIPKFCFFSKAALAALNFMDWIPDVIHCHDWQAALVPVYLRTLFATTKLSSAKTMLTIHNLRFQGVYNIPTIRYWSGLPTYVFNKDALTQNWLDANMLKGGLTYCNMITTVSGTYAGEIQTREYGEGLDTHLRYHSGKLRGIVNGIDYDIWNPWTDPMLHTNYDITNVLPRKKENKRALQEELGLWQDDHKFVIGLISRLTNQKGLDLVNAIMPQIMDEHTQVVVLGTGDKQYEDAFRYYEDAYRGNVCSSIMYDEGRAHRIYAGCDAVLVPSQFEPCGLTQLIGMHYGTIPIVRETGGLKDTVEPRNPYTNSGNGFTFDRYDAGLLLDAINRAKTFYFTNRYCWDEMVQRDMDKNVSWENSAWQYRNLYLQLTQDKQ